MKLCKRLVLLISLVVVLMTNFTGCIIADLEVRIENEELKNSNANDYITKESLEYIRFDGVAIRPVIRTIDYEGYYVIIVGAYSKEQDKKIILQDIYIKTNTNEILLDEKNLNISILTDEEYSGIYRNSMRVAQIPEDPIKSRMKLFLTLVVENEEGESENLEYIFNANGYWWPRIMV